MKEKILILRLSSLGDILLATPFIRQVRTAFPQADIDFVIKEQFHDVIRANPHLNRIFKVRQQEGLRGLLKLRQSLVKRKYTYIFDLHNNMRTRILTLFLHAPHLKRIKKGKIKRFLLVNFKINFYKKIIPVSERYLKTAESAHVRDDGYGLEIFWKDFQENKLNKKMHGLNLPQQFIVLAPGATAFTKKWPIEYYSAVIRSLINQGERILILGSEQDKETFDELVQSKKVINLAGKTSILDTAVIIRAARAMICNDSGLMHMAAAVKTPLLAIFGSTVKELGFGPYRSENKVVENKGLACRPCSHVGRDKCPQKHFKCMKEIKPEMVLKRFGELL